MGRGGGGGGRSGGFRSGGGRGFSSHRSTGGAHRGGGRLGGAPGGFLGGMGGMTGGSRRPPGRMGSTPPPPPPPPPGGFGPRYPRRRRPIIGGWPIFIPVERQSRPYREDSPYEGVPRQTREVEGARRKNGIPGWYLLLMALMLVLTVVLLSHAAKARSAAASATVREKLPAQACILSDEWMDDELGWISDRRTVTQAMSYFYNKTGVQPFLLICSEMDGMGGEISDEQAKAYLKKRYDSLYQDEGHMIFAFMEYESSQYITYLYTGTAADGVIDDDARELFLNAADRYYTDGSLSDEEYFAKVFTWSADEIMRDTAGNAGAATFYAAAAVAVLVVMAGGLILFKIQEKRTEEARQLKEVIDTPLPKSTEEQELERKYGKDT